MTSTDTLTERFFQHLAPSGQVGGDEEQRSAVAAAMARLSEERGEDRAAVRVLNPTMDDGGWTSRQTVVQVVTDDMPFLVDSVLGEVGRHGLGVHQLVHPQLVVDDSGEVLDADPKDAGDGQRVESWIYVEVDRVPDTDRREALQQDLERVLADVRRACRDWGAMRQQARAIVAELEIGPPKTVPADEIDPVVDFLKWIDDHHFTYLGYRSYDLVDTDDGLALQAVAGSGLGILRETDDTSADPTVLRTEAARTARDPQLLTVTKANTRATVHRTVPLDYLGIRRFDDKGEVVGEHRFLGLFTQSAYAESTQRLPIVGAKVKQVLAQSGFAPDSHSGKDLLSILEAYPRDELFQASVEQLAGTAGAVVRLLERPAARVFTRPDEFGRFVSALVYLPRDRYNTANRLRVQRLLEEVYGGELADYATRVGDGPLAQLHFVISVPKDSDLPDVDQAELQQRLAAATRTWVEGLSDAVAAHVEDEGATGDLVARFADAFPEAYKEDFDGEAAYLDLQRMGELHSSDASARPHVYRGEGDAPTERRLKVYRSDPMTLTHVLPVFADLGLEVTVQRPYELDGSNEDGSSDFIYDFGLRAREESVWTGGEHRTEEEAAHAFEDAFTAIWGGASESDTLNSLVLTAGLDWRRVVILRTLVRYLRQVGTFSLDYLEEALVANPEIARLLIDLFAARFDPGAEGGEEAREQRVADVSEELYRSLDEVASLDQDRILRSLADVVRATLRTNFYQHDEDGRPKAWVSLKLLPRELGDLLPEPRPAFEIWVYAPRVEGSHLRFGPVARGGLRWSDRREDFRTEVLGLVKAQMVKNAVIVPTGSKGAFFPKLLPDPAVDREAWMEEGRSAYRTFISGMLDITDNRLGGEVQPPEQVVRHDGDDPYLVVAADKGTATFSDIANGVARDYGFWLDDAFASGGSAGYDHKGMGITARGAWESVKRHFRELGLDTQSEEFTVVGVGDMSGDVFGNGMLLSEHILLVAAFDHRHIFLDPDPDAETSFAERQRLFELPRSSWADYDTSLLSEGGGIYPRSQKSIPVSDQVRARLGIADEVTSMTPHEMLRAILGAPVDLLWNGGIGTYVKAQAETDAQIGDRANDPIRVDGKDLRVRVVGEGGNLGLSQRGRIEAAEHGVHVNTDAIDNSAGVDTSDHEVNIKIALAPLVQGGEMTMEERDELLASMTEEVARKVLRHNYDQNVLIGNGRHQREVMATVHQRLIRYLGEHAGLDPELEFLPDELKWERRESEGHGLTSPEFSVVVAYAKLGLKAALIETELPDDPALADSLLTYFPEPLREVAGEEIHEHPLRRQIVVNEIANAMVNRGGVSFAFRAEEETGATIAQITRAFHVVRSVFGLADFTAAVEELDNQVTTEVQTELYLEFRRLLDRATRWFLNNRSLSAGMDEEIARFEEVRRLVPALPELLQGHERERWQERAEWARSNGIPEELADVFASLLDSYSLLDVVELAREMDRDVDEVAQVYFGVSEAFRIDDLLTHVSHLPREDRWSSLARGALRDDLYGVMRGLTRTVVERTDGDGSDEALERVREWMAENREALVRTSQVLRTVSTMEEPDLAPLSVALRTLRGLVRQGSAD
ncbi:NAD-specific glutamate dehydrogenase, large form [Serinicoccus hydrothermalis]|uniref:NAD-specific glutamate dehydrogenase, large form n=1 Tax=Serinicoccus hydrothermalis TaxID=1758689 RepID=A0A1B1NAD6_9MICO|nr:NAD-glutamate dehydrogenase [Serinicoccus hydrothermalis]ANS78397.1 NAD-specific glutamate dehydrogenase, large form [Serinicoccus hydrothermalis]